MEMTHTMEKRRRNNVHALSHVMKHEPDLRQSTLGFFGNFFTLSIHENFIVRSD